jgi:hypothetical protein
MSPAPKRRQCGTQQVNERLCEMDYAMRERQSRIEDQIRRSITSGQAQRVTRQLIKIPVVVHVVYRTETENISTEQIKCQIDALNRDYRLRNDDQSVIPEIWKGVAADANIEFALASKDPKGKRRPVSRARRRHATRSARVPRSRQRPEVATQLRLRLAT